MHALKMCFYHLQAQAQKCGKSGSRAPTCIHKQHSITLAGTEGQRVLLTHGQIWLINASGAAPALEEKPADSLPWECEISQNLPSKHQASFPHPGLPAFIPHPQFIKKPTPLLKEKPNSFI